MVDGWQIAGGFIVAAAVVTIYVIYKFTDDNWDN